MTGASENYRRWPARITRLAVRGVAIVTALCAALFAVAAPGQAAGGTPGRAVGGPAGQAAVVALATSVPGSVLAAVGTGQGVTGPGRIHGSALTSAGKPELLYIGADYCPYCAMEQWAMIVALSRFGTFTGLNETRSIPSDVYPDTATLRFYGATYRSKYFTFVSVDVYTNALHGNSYTPLQHPTKAEQALWVKYGEESFPFLDFGNAYAQIGVQASPAVVHGLSWLAIAKALHDPFSPVAKAVDGSANYLIATICELTGNRPASACTPQVRKLEAGL
jgi:thiol-disulfide isomerase/thioredoxin